MNWERKSALALAGAVGMFVATAVATPAQAAGDRSAPPANPTSIAAGCVEFNGWTNIGTNRYVTVENWCGSKKCYRVDIPYSTDPLMSVAAWAVETDRYASNNLPQGRGIYEDSCF
ncbi:hypothetical protein AB0J82_35145 [Asanoa sp. NPDC049518]|uniref:hypothetical protein n=1 Tax=unclassified Asanoa TaxID=2685164 RepID=UPI00342EE1B9